MQNMPDSYANFLDSNIGNCQHFKWKEALYLPSWDIHVFPYEDIALNIIQTANRMDAIRNILGKPIHVVNWYRPPSYNQEIGGSKFSQHMNGLAVDFYVKGYNSEVVRELLLDFLVRLNIRMEDLPGANWVHIDLGPVGKNRFFKP